MRIRNLLCCSVASLIALSVPAVGMLNAYGAEDDVSGNTGTGSPSTIEATIPATIEATILATTEATAPDTTEATTPDTTEASIETTESAGNIEEPELSEEEKAHQSVLCRHDFAASEADAGSVVTETLNLNELWDIDIINVVVYSKSGQSIKTGKLYLTSKTGAWEDKLIKELSFSNKKASLTMGYLRDNFDNNLFADANLKLVVDDPSALVLASVKLDSELDAHKYDEWITETDENGNTVYSFYGRNYDSDLENTGSAFWDARLTIDVGDFTGKFVNDESFTVDISGDVSFIMFDYVDEEWRQASGKLTKSGSYKGPVWSSNYGNEVEFQIYNAAPGSKITLQRIRIGAVDYAGEIDESIDTSKPVTLKNLSTYIGGYQYDVSMLPAQAGKIIVEFEPAEEMNGLRLDRYNNINSPIDLKNPVNIGDTTSEFFVTAEEMEELRKGTMRLDSESLNITKVSFVKSVLSPDKFHYGDNPCSLKLDNEQEYIHIPASAFERLTGKGSEPVTLTFETDSSVEEPWVQYRYGLTDLHKITDKVSVKGKTSYKAWVWGVVDSLKINGLYIFGNGITITNVNIDKGNPMTGDGCSPVREELTAEELEEYVLPDNDDTDNESDFTSSSNGFELNKMYSQKISTNDGKYSQRFIMQVEIDDIADAKSYYIIVSNGTKYVKINCSGLSSSITINGNKIEANEGCVFLSAAVVDVNDNVQLSYSDFMVD